MDKNLIVQLCQTIDTSKTGRILVRDIIECLKSVSIKYDKQRVLAQIANDIEEPVAQFLSNQGFSVAETYQKNDFVDLLLSVSQTSKFHLLCVFYDLSGQSEELAGKVFVAEIQRVKQEAKGKKSQ